MRLLHLFLTASMPIVKVFLLISIGLFLALDHVAILSPLACKLLNHVVFYVFNPALMGSSLAKTITFSSLLSLWFMPVNILLTYMIGSVLGWILVKITKAPKHLKGLVIGSCSAGNVGYMIIIIVPAICKEKGSPFGAADVCQTYGLSYSSLSMALGGIYVWVYVYNILRVSSGKTVQGAEVDDVPAVGANDPESNINGDHTSINTMELQSLPSVAYPQVVPLSSSMKQGLRKFSKKINLKALLAPSTIGAIAGFVVGLIPPFRKLLIGNDAPLHVVEDTASMLGEAAVPAIILILGANLLQGFKRSHVHIGIIIGILVIRYVFLPLLGVIIIRGAVRFGLVQSHNLLFQFILLLQHAVPPAMSIGTMTQQFGAGQSECSIIMMWAYGMASVALTFWCTFFLWLVAS